MEKLIECGPGYDKRDPNPSKDYGICGMHIRFVLIGDKGATQFVIFTDWYPPDTQQRLFDEAQPGMSFFSMKPMGADVGYHSPVSQYDGQEPIDDECPYLDGKPCHYDGSGLAADALVKVFLVEGVDAVWDELQDEYDHYFGDAP